jgi:acetolactate synthase-1/2/3 large subunit
MCFRIAMTGRYGPCFLELPIDVLFGKVEEAFAPVRQRYRPPGRVAGDPALIIEAARLLEKAERPVVTAGSDVYWSDAGDTLRRLVERLGAPVYLSSMARGCVRQDHPLFFSHTRRAALSEADAALIIGAPLDFRLSYGRDLGDDCRIIQIDTDPTQIGRNRSFTVGIEGDARLVLEALLAVLGEKTAAKREWVDGLRRREQNIEEERRRWLESDAVPIHPLRLCKEMAAFVDEDTLVVGDGGDIVNLASQVLPINNPGQWFDPGPMGTLGVGTGFAIAAKIAHPEKRVLLVNGDGSFGLNAFEFDTMVRCGLPIVSVVGNDRQWGQIAMTQLKAYGDQGVIASHLADNARYDKVVEALGGHGELVVEPSQIRPALERAFASGKPACVNVLTDPRPPGVTSAEPI